MGYVYDCRIHPIVYAGYISSFPWPHGVGVSLDNYTQTPEQMNAISDDDGTVRKDLDDADRTNGFTVGHYSHDEVAAACHASEGASHE